MTIDELLSLAGLTANDEIPVWDAEAIDEPTKKITAQNLAASVKALAGLVGETDALLHMDEINDTVQSIVFDSVGNVSTITHVRNNVMIREDEFTFGDGTITEVRTLNTGETLTIVTNTNTLQTTITYTAA
jgi:hypothetical protein